MRARSHLASALASLALAACDPQGGAAPGAVGSPPPKTPDLRFAGTYDVRGLTTDPDTGETRRIAGTVVLAGAGDGYDATFSLATQIETPDGPVQADLIGTGEGKVAAEALEGTADTRMFLAAIPGLDPKFPWIPGRLGPRVHSDFRMRPEGPAFRIEIASRPAPGAAYAPTTTVLRAVRSTATAAVAVAD